MAAVTIETTGYIKGRNVMADLSAIEVWTGGINHAYCFIDGIGKRGSVINGGLQVEAAAFEKLCRQYIAARQKEKKAKRDSATTKRSG